MSYYQNGVIILLLWLNDHNHLDVDPMFLKITYVSIYCANNII